MIKQGLIVAACLFALGGCSSMSTSSASTSVGASGSGTGYSSSAYLCDAQPSSLDCMDFRGWNAGAGAGAG
jgi:hypothetical protein